MKGIRRGAFSGGPNQTSAPEACPTCNEVLASRGHLGQHRRRAHGKPTSRPPAAAPIVQASSAETTLVAGAASVAIAIGRPTPARYLPNAVPVTPAIVALPWIKFSRTASDCAKIVARVDEILARTDGATDAECVFWATLRAHVAAIAMQAAATP